MAIMCRTKRANAQRWGAINRQREKENSQKEPEKEEQKKTQMQSKEEREKWLKSIREATTKKD